MGIPFQADIDAVFTETTVASAATTDLTSVGGRGVYVTATPAALTISSFGSRKKKTYRVKFAAGITIQNGASLLCPGGVNIVTTQNDTCELVSDAAGVFSIRNYQKYVGTAINIQSFGGKPDGGTTDNLAKLNVAMSYLPARGGKVYFPGGASSYDFSDVANLNLANSNQCVVLIGDGQNSTELRWPTTDGIVATLKDATTAFHMRDMSVTTGKAVTQTGVTIKITATTTNGALGEYSNFTRVTFRGSDGFSQTNGWSVGLNNSNVSNVGVYGCSFLGTSGSLGTGLSMVGLGNTSLAVVLNVTNTNFIHLNIGANLGSYTQGISFSNLCNFTACTNGIYVPANALGILSQLSVIGCQFEANANAGGAAINMMTGFNPVTIMGNLFLSDGSNTQINMVQHSFGIISNNDFYSPNPNNNTAIATGTGASHFKICDNVIFGFALGIGLPNTTSNMMINDNNMGNNTQHIANAGTAANNNRITNNNGYQPQVPANQTVGSSPYTYSSPGTPCTVYVTGGVVTQVKVDGAVIANASPGSVVLEPNQRIDIAFTMAPNVIIAVR